MHGVPNLRILIVGGGAVAEELLSRLDLKTHSVIVVEKDPERRRILSQRYDVQVIAKDATDVTLYTTDIRMSDIDVVIALTGRNEINLFVLAVAKMYNVPFRLAKVTDSRLAELLRNLDLGIPVCQPSLVASIISNFLQTLREPWYLASLGEYKLYLISLSETDRASGQKVNDLGIPNDIKIILIFDGSNIYYPSEDTVLGPGFQLLVLAKANIDEVIRYLKG
ncbi:MAG: potassium transporter TrkA [Thermoprotei archaeon]|nr:MAG: potassium transporter TrkA [Thermoprotei archaeon]